MKNIDLDTRNYLQRKKKKNKAKRTKKGKKKGKKSKAKNGKKDKKAKRKQRKNRKNKKIFCSVISFYVFLFIIHERPNIIITMKTLTH